MLRTGDKLFYSSNNDKGENFSKWNYPIVKVDKLDCSEMLEM